MARCRGLRLWALGLALSCCGWAGAACAGQIGEVTPAERARLFELLDREAAAQEGRVNILKTVVKLVSPSVAHIEWHKRERYSRRTRDIEEAGSGAVIELGGQFYVITNWHVVRDAELKDLKIVLEDGRRLTPLSRWKDTETDVAVIAVEETDLMPARIGNSDALEIGDFVLAVGSPFGLSHSVTYGIISAKGRRDLELGDSTLKFQDFLQTDAAINPGNSGGPLINLRGEIIGINTAIASNSGGNEGIGFTIPINMVMTIARQLVEHGKVVRAFLGINMDRAFTLETAQRLGLSRRRGACISGVIPSSAAERAGLQVDDVILEFNHVPVDDDAHLINLVSLTEIGHEVPLLVFRDKQEITVMVQVGDRSQYEKKSSSLEPPPEQQGQVDTEAWDVDSLGLTVIELAALTAAQRSELASRGGLFVSWVDPAGPLSGRVRQGDVIVEIESIAIQRIEDLERAMTLADLSQEIELRVAGRSAASQSPRTITVRPQIATALAH